MAFTINFDQKKMYQPNLQNDFSYYKRNLSKQADDFKLDREDSERKAGLVSFFIAEALPMTKKAMASLSGAAGGKKMRTTIADFANSCCYLIKAKKFGDSSPYNTLCLRAMVSCLVVYDNIDVSGAYSSK